MRTILVVIVSFLLAVPAAFSQSDVAVPVGTYDFELENNSDRTLSYKCGSVLGLTSGWKTLSANNSEERTCDVPNVALFALGGNTIVAHECTGGTRKVTVTGSTEASMTTSSGGEVTAGNP